MRVSLLSSKEENSTLVITVSSRLVFPKVHPINTHMRSHRGLKWIPDIGCPIHRPET